MTTHALFPPRPETERDIWQCDCGSVAFLICATGQAICAECHVEAARMRGYWKILDDDEGGQAVRTALRTSLN